MLKREAVVLALALAACGGGSTGSTTTTTTDPVTTTTIKTATVSQVASAIAQSDAGIRSSVAQIDDCYEVNAPTCDLPTRLTFLTLNFQVQTLVVTLTGISKDSPTNKSYRGAVPEELVPLVQSTLTKARALLTKLDAVDSNNCLAVPGAAAVPTSSCGTVLPGALIAAGSLVTELDAWRPYL